MKKTILLIFSILFLVSFQKKDTLPNGFSYVDNKLPTIITEIRYHSKDNFVGKKIDGYEKSICILTNEAIAALDKIQKELITKNLGLKIYDGYRPQQAVNEFVRWARVLNDTIMKQKYYPNVKKKNLFRDGYIASKSGHSRGSTVDVTLVNFETGEELDMGSPWDFFGKESWVKNPNLTPKQKKNRQTLQKIMNKHGFRSYSKEWWHFTLKNEPYPKTYFNFPVK
ncbi:M15 family metallopeptidase [Aureivirga marina]|uniref:M15 family metallopeptidase n=1 Tax=Aureivirga marina TaxID=1182451 RepID=UPI0018CA8EDF|nr:M15 family metallopeptidase [Aureivirga marina]